MAAKRAVKSKAKKTKAKGAKKTKAASSAKYLASTIRVMDGIGINGSKPRPFSYEAAIRAVNHWVYAAQMMNANAVANVPMRLFAKLEKGRKYSYGTRPISKQLKKYFAGDYSVKPSTCVLRKAAQYGEWREVIESNPVLTTLQTVNPWQNGYELTELRILDQQTTGNSYFNVVFDPSLGIPIELWRMPPQWTKIIPSKRNFIDGYSYGRGQDVEQVFTPNEVIHFKMPNLKDVHYGMGWEEAVWTAIGLHEAKREFDTARADNYARPDWLLAYKQKPGKDELDRTTAVLKEKFGGRQHAGKPIVIGGDVTATPLNFEEAEYGTPTRLIEEVAAASGVSISMLLTNDPNRANSEAARLSWYRNTVRQYCQRDQEKLNEKYLPLFGDASENLMLCYDEVCFEDRAALMKENVAGVAGGILYPNEARQNLGYEDSDDPNATKLYPPSGNAGTSAVTQDMAVNQNDQQNNG